MLYFVWFFCLVAYQSTHTHIHRRAMVCGSSVFNYGPYCPSLYFASTTITSSSSCILFLVVVVVVNAEMWQKEKETKKNQVIVQLFLYLLLQTTTTNTSTIEVSLIYSVRYISRHYLRQSRYKLHFYY